MKKRFNIKPYQLFALIAIVFASVSCSEKFFDEQNAERITPEQHYKSMVDVQTSLGGAFAPLQQAIPKLIMIDGLRSDQMIATSSADPFVKDINEQILSYDNPYLDASDYYKVIINCNEALANIHKVSEVDRNFNRFYLNYTQLALMSLKSWTYLNLVKIYGQAALIEDNLTSIPGDLNQTILNKEDMINTLIKPLEDSINSKDYTNAIELRFVNYPNPKAVLGELYLEKGDYANAAKYLKLAAESYGNLPAVYKVDALKMEAWKTIFTSSESSTGRIHSPAPRDLPPGENISVVGFDHQEGQFNPLAKWLLPTDLFMAKPTDTLVSLFNSQVPSAGVGGDKYRGYGASIDTTANGEVYVNKYYVGKSEPFSSDIIVSRAADIHLLLAEALNRLGEEKKALALMNDGFSVEKPLPAEYSKWNKNIGIRGRAYLAKNLVPDSITVINGADTTKVLLQGEQRIQYIEDLIIQERSLELAFEGKRWFDLVRIATRRSDPEYLIGKVTSKFTDPAQKEAVRQRLLNPANWYLPFKKEVPVQ